MLKAIKAEIIEPGKPKFMISGKSGAGKTFFALDFANVYYIDVEGGAVRRQYREKLVKNGGVYFGKEQGSQDFNTVIEEIRALATTKHPYKTLVIDSFSFLYNAAAAIAEEKIGNQFGRDKKEANRPTRQMMRWLESLDMSVILICHSKDKWERRGSEIIHSGTTFDGFEKLEYVLDLWLEISKSGTNRNMVIKKSRIESFPEGESFPADYKEFAVRYGQEILEKDSKPVELATPELVSEAQRLSGVVKLEEGTIEKWFDKAKVDSWEEMTADQVEKCVKFMKSKLEAK